jgi:regulatory protein
MNKALGYALCLLKFRPRSEYELSQRLKRRGFLESNIKETLLFLKEKGLVNDLEFARIWVESRIKRNLGISRIKQELKIKGIDKDIIRQVIASVGLRYNEEERLKELIHRRWERLKHVEPQKAKRRLFLYLLRRGFSSNMIQEAINQIRSNK